MTYDSVYYAIAKVLRDLRAMACSQGITKARNFESTNGTHHKQ